MILALEKNRKRDIFMRELEFVLIHLPNLVLGRHPGSHWPMQNGQDVEIELCQRNGEEHSVEDVKEEKAKTKIDVDRGSHFSAVLQRFEALNNPGVEYIGRARKRLNE